jgi:hypothetical protein
MIIKCLHEDLARDGRAPDPAEKRRLAAHVAEVAEMLATQGVVRATLALSAVPAEEERWLEPDEVLAKYPTFTRRQLFGGGLPFVKRTSPRKILISEQGLKRWLERRR